jgi:signal transduction histidine kinase
MKKQQLPRLGGPSDPEDRDTRLDPIDTLEGVPVIGRSGPGPSPADKTEPGMALSELEARALLSTGPAGGTSSPQDRLPVRIVEDVNATFDERASVNQPVGSPLLPSLEPLGEVVLYEEASESMAVPRISELPEGVRPRAPRRRAGWPFLPLAPLLVVVVGVAVALGIGLVGLDQLSRASDDHAGARAELIAATVAARLGALPSSRWQDATVLARRRSFAELLVVTASGEVVHDATLGPPDPLALRKMLSAKKGVADMRLGRARFAVRPIAPTASNAGELDDYRVLVLVPEPRAAEGANALVSALAALAVLLLGVAAAVAYAVSRDVARDLDFVTDRVRTMAQIRTEPTGELIPTRTMDEVGILTATFNKLVGRFGKAQGAYREDLARASAADRERAAFLAAVSHELRSPLNAILGFADILMEEVDGPLSPSAREEVEQIRGSGVHLLGLINDILEFSALESGQLRLSRSRVDVFALANEVMKEARGLVGDRPLSVRLEGESVLARLDGRRVRQILGNLVNNAIKFTQQGEVVVRVQREGGLVTLSVRDTGPGISAQERAIIFEEYKQVGSEGLRRRGTGLGLAITRRLVMLHHGSINVDSELGRGSTFKVLLPIGNVDAPPSRRLDPKNRPPGLGAPT